MSLREYKKKRDFCKTEEPEAIREKSLRHRFVIQKHEATRLHYDFRLELDGALKSWAIPKGLPHHRGEKRLAIHVEDHPVAYINFEGNIPKGQYGGGIVMVWDRGTFEPLSKTPLKDLAGGKLHFILHGQKLHGEWYLVQLKKTDQWLIIRGGDDIKPVPKKSDNLSALSGKTMEQIARSNRIWLSKSKANIPTPHSRQQTNGPATLDSQKFIEPMKAKLVSKPPSGKWIYEIKFDGWRALALKAGNSVRLLSRNKKNFAEKFPEVVNSILKLNAHSVTIDGEIVALDNKGRSSFQLLQAYDIGEEKPPIFFYAFDLLHWNGKDLCSLPVLERKTSMEKLLKNPPGVIRCSTALGSDAVKLLVQARKMGLEGLIGKKVESQYETGRRTGSWIKLKLHTEQEFVIGGYKEPEGTRKYFGSLIVGYHEGKNLLCAGKVGTEFDHKLLAKLFSSFRRILRTDCPFANLPAERGGRWGQGITLAEMKRCHWLDPILVCQIKFSQWTRDGRLRQPVFLGLRKDKNANEVIRERAS